MHHLTSIELAELRRHELRVDAAHARLAAAATRGRRRRRRRDAVTAPATTTGGHPAWAR